MFRLIISMSLPAMFSMLVQSLYNIVDSFFVAQIGENALTAMSLAFPMQMLLISVAVGTSTGLGSYISRMLGAKKQDQADSAATHGVVLSIFTWVIFLIIGIFVSRPFFASFTDVEEIIEMGTQYLTICFAFSFGVFVEINFERTLQATGNMIFPMLFQLTGAVSNAILAPIFIFGWLGVPNLGVMGAGIATVIAQNLAMLFSIIVVAIKNHNVRIRFKGFRLDWFIIRKIYEVGFPSIIMQSMGTVMTIAMNLILISFSDTAVAVLGVYFRLQSFVFMPVFGLTLGVMPIMGYNYGAKNKHRLMSALKTGTVIASIIMAVGMLIFLTIPNLLISIFNPSEYMLSIGVTAFRIISFCFVPAALGIMTSSMFQAVGKGLYSLIISVLRQLVILVPVAFLLAQFRVLDNVWYAFPIAEVVSMILSFVYFARLYKKEIHHLEAKTEMA